MKTADNTAFGTIDGERCFFTADQVQKTGFPGFGALGVQGGEGIIHPLNKLALAAHHTGVKMFHTLDKHPKETAHFAKPPQKPNYINTWDEHGVDGTDGSLLHPGLLIALNSDWSTEYIKGDIAALTVYEDTSYTGALAHIRGEKELLPDALKRAGIRYVYLGGLALGNGAENKLCVDSTAADFVELGFDVTVVTDAVEAVLPENREICLDNLGKMGVHLATIHEALDEIEALALVA